MAPVYDVLSTVPYIPDDETAALRYSRTKKMTEFSRDELAHLAAKALLPEKLVMDAARETVERFEEIWTVEKSHLPLDRKVMTRGRGPSRAGANLRRVPNSVIVQVLTGLKTHRAAERVLRVRVGLWPEVALPPNAKNPRTSHIRSITVLTVLN